MNPVLVTGATGNVGSELVRALRDRGVPVRAFVRDPERAATVLGPDVDLAVGDYADPGSVRRALAGTGRAFLACGNIRDQVRYEYDAIDLMRDAGVRLVVKLSAPGGPDARLVYPRRHGEIERHLRAAGLPAVLLRPGFFMTNLLGAADAVAASGVLVAPAGGARIAMIHPRDIAAVAAVALTEDGHAGRGYALTGPAAITYDDVARDLERATGRPVRFVDVPDDAARADMLDAGLPAELAGFLVGLFAELRAGICAETNDAVRSLTGRDPRPFAESAAEHAERFGGRALAAAPAGEGA
jgi:uncharacterized protein YbjT (DUF2867 family)